MIYSFNRIHHFHIYGSILNAFHNFLAYLQCRKWEFLCRAFSNLSSRSCHLKCISIVIKALFTDPWLQYCSCCNNVYIRLYFWAPGSEPTLRQCHETSRIFTGTERIFASVDRGDVIFYRFVFEGKRDFWLFGRPQPLKKPKKSKGPFFEKTNR